MSPHVCTPPRSLDCVKVFRAAVSAIRCLGAAAGGCMKKASVMLLMVTLGVLIGLAISGKLAPVEARTAPGARYAAGPGAVGSQDLTGPYDVFKNWPQDISSLPGN